MPRFPLLTAVVLLSAAILLTSAGPSQALQPVHLLLVNDDGVDAPGLAALAVELAADPAYRVTVVAPADPQSGTGHALTIKGEVRVTPHKALSGCPTWAVAATPATTVNLALTALLADDPPDLLVSGINRGENVGRIAWYSGTVAAAREAVLNRVPAIAFSHQLSWDDPRPDFEAAARWAKPVVDAVRFRSLPEGVLLNVNIPAQPQAIMGYRITAAGLAPDRESRWQMTREDEGSRWYEIARWRPAREDHAGSDTHGLHAGWVVITPLGLDQTVYTALPALMTLQPVAPVGPAFAAVSEPAVPVVTAD